MGVLVIGIVAFLTYALSCGASPLLNIPFASIVEEENADQTDLSLRGLVLVGCEEDLITDPQEMTTVRGIKTRSVFVPGKISELEDAVWCEVEGKSLGLDTVSQIEQIVSRYYIEKQYPFIIIRVPSQRIQEGVLQIIVEPSRLGAVRVEGNRWESEEKIIKLFRMEPGEWIDQGQVLKGLNFLNKNFFRKTDLFYLPGYEAGTTDISLMVQEKDSWRIYSGVDNTGVLSTGRQRFFAGVNWGNAFWHGDMFSAQYTAAFDFKDLQAATVQYLLFLPSQTTLNLYGGYSSVHADLPFPNMVNHGESYQASARYSGSLRPTPEITQEYEVGFDYRATNNTVEFVEQFPIFSKLVNLTQLEAGYSIEKQTPSFSALFKIRLFTSFGAWLPHQTNADFASLRQGAENHWVYVSGIWDATKKFDSAGTFSFFGQYHWSSQSLLPSEQLGIGGYDSVRGYEERQFNADTGAIASLEYRTPSFPIFSAKKSSKANDALLFLAFADFGYGRNHTPPFPGQKQQYLASVGPGLRYFAGSSVSVRVDWGIRLHNKAGFNGGTNLFHFGAVASY